MHFPLQVNLLDPFNTLLLSRQSSFVSWSDLLLRLLLLQAFSDSGCWPTGPHDSSLEASFYIGYSRSGEFGFGCWRSQNFRDGNDFLNCGFETRWQFLEGSLWLVSIGLESAFTFLTLKLYLLEWFIYFRLDKLDLLRHAVQIIVDVTRLIHKIFGFEFPRVLLICNFRQI